MTDFVYGHAGFPSTANLIVGANIKFDLLWAARDKGTTPAKLVEGKRVWDVCLAEYLLRRQRIRMPSLEDCAESQGIPMAKHPLGESIKAGTCPSSFKIEDLVAYNRQDLLLTDAVFKAQFKEAVERGMLPLIWSQMQALVATAEMEHNGLTVDISGLGRLRSKLVAYSDALLSGLDGIFAATVTVTKHELLDLLYVPCGAAEIVSSNKLLSLLFFGGEYSWEAKESAGTYKNGKPKYKKVTKTTVIPRYLNPSLHNATMGKLGYFAVDEEVLKSISLNSELAWARETADTILKYRAAQKQLTTYIDGMSKHVWPDHKVHCNFNHNVTLTGRLSCSSPNLQNVDGGEAKGLYIPSHSENVFIEFDYAQLEVLGLAILSGDHQLIEDIRGGVDVHTALYHDMYGRTPTKEERKHFKPLTFGLIYGAGVNTLSQNAKVPVSTARHFVDTFYRRYPQVKKYHEGIVQNAKLHREPTSEKTDKGFPRGKYVHRLATGREFEFLEYDNDFSWKDGKTSFSPTELKNWPIQGFATGDIVPLMVGYVVQEITKSEFYGLIKPVATVHDSIMFEVPYKIAPEAVNFLKKLLSNTRAQVLAQFGFDPGLDFEVEYKIGYNWKDME